MEEMRMYELDPDEQFVEDNAPGYRPVSFEKRQVVEVLLEKARKNRNINIRMSEQDLNMIKLKSVSEGIPCQTLISSVLHRYAAGSLVEETAVLKAVELLSGKTGHKH